MEFETLRRWRWGGNAISRLRYELGDGPANLLVWLHAEGASASVTGPIEGREIFANEATLARWRRKLVSAGLVRATAHRGKGHTYELLPNDLSVQEAVEEWYEELEAAERREARRVARAQELREQREAKRMGKRSGLQLLRATLGRGPAGMFVFLALMADSQGFAGFDYDEVYGYRNFGVTPQTILKWQRKLEEAGLVRVARPIDNVRDYSYQILGSENLPLKQRVDDFLEEEPAFRHRLERENRLV